MHPHLEDNPQWAGGALDNLLDIVHEKADCNDLMRMESEEGARAVEVACKELQDLVLATKIKELEAEVEKKKKEYMAFKELKK